MRATRRQCLRRLSVCLLPEPGVDCELRLPRGCVEVLGGTGNGRGSGDDAADQDGGDKGPPTPEAATGTEVTLTLGGSRVGRGGLAAVSPRLAQSLSPGQGGCLQG